MQCEKGGKCNVRRVGSAVCAAAQWRSARVVACVQVAHLQIKQAMLLSFKASRGDVQRIQ